MQIRRYLNGRPITQRELAGLELVTDELRTAVRDVRRRLAGEAGQAEGKVYPPVTEDVREVRADG